MDDITENFCDRVFAQSTIQYAEKVSWKVVYGWMDEMI